MEIKSDKGIQLTQSQLLLWTGQKLNPEAPLYNMAHSFDISGSLHIQNFQKAFQELICRADALRTIFYEIDNIPYQTVFREVPYQLEVIDFSTIKDETIIHNWLKERSRLKFDMAQPLFDAVLLKIHEERFIWFLNIHHLITDATSSTILYKIMSTLYRHINENSLEVFAKIPSFKSYVLYEQQERNSKKKEQIHSYWNKKISTLHSTPVLYGNKKNGTTTQAHRISLKLGTQRSNQFRELAKQTEIRSWTPHLTLFNLFTTVLFSYLYRVSGQKKLAIGTPSHNRPTKIFKETAGMFIEIYPLITEMDVEDTFNTVLQRIKLETNSYLRYAQPGMSNAAVSRSFNVVLNYINVSFPDFDGMKMKSEWIHPNHTDPAHQLRCHVVDFDATGEIEIFFDLNHGTFDKYLSQKVPQHFLKLIDAMLADINTPVNQVEIITIAEKNMVLERLALKEPYSPFLELFYQSVKDNTNSTALRFWDNLLSYGDLNKKADQLASYLQQQGLKSKDKVGLYFFRSPEYIISLIAIMKLRATFVPIASDQPYERIDYILEDSDCRFVLTDSMLKINIHNTSARVLEVNLESIAATANKEIANGMPPDKDDIAYILYTSGSTGNPKGVMISHGALSNYLRWARIYYKMEDAFIFPFFTSIGFDLTITSTFLPLLSGGELVIYRESDSGPDISLLQVIADNKVNSIKLTPSHIALIQGMDLSSSAIRTMIVGGEDFRTSVANEIRKSLGKKTRIYNEYGPTEATVGCIVCEFDPNEHKEMSVPIGKPISNMNAYVLDTSGNLVPEGVVGELYLSGIGLSGGYSNLDALTKKKFIENNFVPNTSMYSTGDLARIDNNGDFAYLGRIDEQVKLNGFRIELSDIEANLIAHNAVENAAVVLINGKHRPSENEVVNCSDCGLPSNYPNADFDEQNVCHLCNAFKGYKDKTDKYFKTEEELKLLLTSATDKDTSSAYDCLSLLSGGKDSTYILARLVNMGLKVLAFTLDNGYISDQAKANINNVVKRLGVDHLYGGTPHMNKIFVDSLHRHKNVCNGCFKTIYTLSTKVALDKNIPFVVTGLSRGQFFETRLTEELFWGDTENITTIDETILEARKLYHQEEDAVKQLLDVSMFCDESTFDKVQFVDFYRYSDVSLSEMLLYLKNKVAWVRPTDTGRSTNCLINQVGIYVHKKEKGYSNYSFPYSWDVRLGHKTRAETIEEINEYIEEKEVKLIMQEIGYEEINNSQENRQHLVGYYTGNSKLPSIELNMHLSKKLPEYMIPTLFKYLEELPLTTNGKVDKVLLKSLNDTRSEIDTPFVAPRNEIEELLENIWKEVLQLEKVGIHDNFITLGGHSLAAIRITSRINKEIEMNFLLSKIFELPTIADYATFIEETIIELLR